MFGKAIITLFFSLAATAGFSWLISMACSRKSQHSASVVQASTGNLVNVVSAGPAVTFSLPVEFSQANDGSNRVFVIERPGRIQVFEKEASAAAAKTFLDIRSRVSGGPQHGLISLAFDPAYEANGFFYVNYTKEDPEETVISRFKSITPTEADPDSEQILMRLKIPFTNYSGGKLLFGPDGSLYIATNDGKQSTLRKVYTGHDDLN
ncbi:PQQ-dependent sugar dehydrogenase [Arsenicibacter rosenii]|uniref:Glucose/Sorbosone dehydrogenase domain-containing protein n=1 Tax=Arsenicibacter rosenii TaxID=1750698 RepID=A0A1S2VQB5_9BACT|nr:PQQ-dependent sugar dehydrogenase [Arsenicibacter rosenii]OIN60952.1 hypothetical protein BLX24_02385 [Arsenicibacter rosenii]